MTLIDDADALDTAFRSLDAGERLRLLRSRVEGALVFTTSLGLEDQVLLHLIAEAGIAARIVTLDTGRLFAETYTLWAETEARYGLKIEPVFPEARGVETFVGAFGINGFYDSKAARLACCGVRKVDPLARALEGAAGWITGLRADQSDGRSQMPFVAWDEARGLIKASPILDWTRGRAAAFAAAEGIPTNTLHERGFLSIGCAPCTRAVAPGESERAGRWWWEQAGSGECGLHVVDGRLARAGAGR